MVDWNLWSENNVIVPWNSKKISCFFARSEQLYRRVHVCVFLLIYMSNWGYVSTALQLRSVHHDASIEVFGRQTAPDLLSMKHRVTDLSTVAESRTAERCDTRARVLKCGWRQKPWQFDHQCCSSNALSERLLDTDSPILSLSFGIVHNTSTKRRGALESCERWYSYCGRVEWTERNRGQFRRRLGASLTLRYFPFG